MQKTSNNILIKLDKVKGRNYKLPNLKVFNKQNHDSGQKFFGLHFNIKYNPLKLSFHVLYQFYIKMLL